MIGIIDSGIGGFGILREVKMLLPAEPVVYFADQAHFPYGDKSESDIQRLIEHAIQEVIAYGASCVVVACNSASVAALDHARARFTIPLVGTVPGIKPAVEQSKTKRIGVIGTTQTISSDYSDKLKKKFAHDAQIIPAACPGLADAIERGEDVHPLLEKVLPPLLSQNIDTLVLACTHYPLVRKEIEEIAGPNITVLDTNEAIARRVVHVIEMNGLRKNESEPDVFVTTGDLQTLEKQIHRYGVDRFAANGYTVHTNLSL